MPGALSARHILDELAITTNQQVRRDLLVSNLRKIRMHGWVEPVQKEVVDPVAREVTRRQADVMNHQQVDECIGWSGGLIRRRMVPGIQKPAFRVDARTSAT